MNILNSNAIYALLLSFAVSFLVSKLVIYRFGDQIKYMDAAVGGRKIHTETVPRVGGLAIYFGVVLSVLILFYQEITFLNWGWFLFGFSFIFGLGFLDDLIEISWKIKLGGQLGIAGFLVYWLSTQIEAITFFGHLFPINWFVFAPIFVFWFVGIVNSINLIDGMDGLAGGSIIILVVGAIFISGFSQDSISIYIHLSFLGALMAFLKFNRNPALYFMGDGGSMSLGFYAAVLPLIFINASQETSIDVTPFILMNSFFIADTIRVFWTRIKKGQHPLHPDNLHLHHLLFFKNDSHNGTVLSIYGLVVISSFFGVVHMRYGDGLLEFLIYAFLLLCYIFSDTCLNAIVNLFTVMYKNIHHMFSWFPKKAINPVVLLLLFFLESTYLLLITYSASLLTSPFEILKYGLLSSIILLLLPFTAPKRAQFRYLILLAVFLFQAMILSTFPINTMPGFATFLRTIVAVIMGIFVLGLFVSHGLKLIPNAWSIVDFMVILGLLGSMGMQSCGIGIPLESGVELLINYFLLKIITFAFAKQFWPNFSVNLF